MTATLTIAKRFCGPPASGSSGCVSGRLAQLIQGTAVVRLKALPPLERQLTVETTDAGVRLTDRGRTLAEARPGFRPLPGVCPPLIPHLLRLRACA